MSHARGFTVVELIIATAVMVTMTTAVMTLLHDGLVRTPVLEEGTDLHQRARVVGDALTADLRGAGSGITGGPGARFAVIEPRAPWTPPGSVATDVVTIRTVPAQAPRSRLSEPLDPGSGSAAIESAGCPQYTTACGFVAGTRAFVFDSAGHFDVVHIAAIGPGVIVMGPDGTPRAVTYDAGSEIVEASEVTYALDRSTHQLRRTEGGGTFAIADGIDALAFEYLSDGALALLPLAAFQDGPFRGGGARVFDADTLAIRAVRATVRLRSGSDRVPPATVRITVAVRAGW